MKIPELPVSYEPGDVVNGHVLTERGNWVPLDDPQAPAPAAGSPVGPPLSDNPYLRPAQPAPTDASRKTGCAVAIFVFVMIALVFGGIALLFFRAMNEMTSMDNLPTIDFSDESWNDEDWTTWGGGEEGFESPSLTLEDEELELIELTGVEAVVLDGAVFAVAYLEAPTLDRDSVTLMVTFQAQDSAGATLEGMDLVKMSRGEPLVAIAGLLGETTGEIVDASASFTALPATDESNPYLAGVTDFTISTEGFRPEVRATLTADDAGIAPTYVQVTAIARGADGRIVNLGSARRAAPEPGETRDADVPMFGSQPVEESLDWEFSVSED